MISFDLLKELRLNYGQMHPALSRVTSTDGFYLIGTLNLSAIKADTRAKMSIKERKMKGS